MRVILMGAGKVGGYLAQELRRAGNAVVVIERDATRAQKVAEETGALTIRGDGTDLGLLADLDLRASDFFLALTGIDEDNLVACQLTKSAFQVKRVLARLNNPANRQAFEALSVPVVSVTDLLVQVISHEVDLEDLVRIALIGRGEMSLFEVEIPPDAAIRAVEGLTLPRDALLVAVHRGDDIIVPHGSTEIRGNDRILALSRVHLEDEVRNILVDD